MTPTPRDAAIAALEYAIAEHCFHGTPYHKMLVDALDGLKQRQNNLPTDLQTFIAEVRASNYQGDVSAKDIERLCELALTAPDERTPKERDLIDVFLEHPSWELSINQADVEDDPYWMVHERYGSRNDRQWRELARGPTPRAAVLAAMAKIKEPT